MEPDKNNTPFKLASDVAEIMKTLRITPHGVTKNNIAWNPHRTETKYTTF